MNFIIYRMEMRRNLKSFIIWAGSICGILFFGMLFYPAITADGLLTQMESMFENPMMKGVLSVFGADISTLGNLMGFYVTYNSIYNVLLACIFASVLAGNLLAKEEAEKTAEFLFTRPVSRTFIFLSKTAVLISYITLLSLLYFVTSLFALEFVKEDSPRQLELENRDKKLIMEAVVSHPETIYEAFNLTDQSFSEYSLTYASRLLADNPSEIEKMDFNMEDMNSLLNAAMENPDRFFENVLESPEKYMVMFSIPPEGREEFLENVRSEEIEYRTMKESFFQSPDVFLLFFGSNPELTLNQFVKVSGSMDRVIELLNLPGNMEERIFKKYSVRKIATLCTYIYLLICSIGSLILFVSLLVKRGKSVLGAALGLVFFFYFLNSLSSMASGFSPLVKVIGFISPFTWMDSDISSSRFGFTGWRILIFMILTGACLTATLWRLKKKDVLV